MDKFQTKGLIILVVIIPPPASAGALRDPDMRLILLI